MQTVVLLHGFGETSSVWKALAGALALNNRVLTPDYSTLALTTVEDYAAWLHQYLTTQQVDRFVLIGHSMGGYIALAFAEKYPDVLTGLGLFHSTAYADSDERKQKRLDTLRAINEKGPDAFWPGFLPNMYAETFVEQHPELLKTHLDSLKAVPVSAMIAAVKAMRERPDRRSVLEKAPYPVLFIIGLNDRSVPPKDALEQTKLPQQVQETVLAGVGHSGMTEAPEAVLVAVSEFLERTRRGTE